MYTYYILKSILWGYVLHLHHTYVLEFHATNIWPVLAPLSTNSRMITNYKIQNFKWKRTFNFSKCTCFCGWLLKIWAVFIKKQSVVENETDKQRDMHSIKLIYFCIVHIWLEYWIANMKWNYLPVEKNKWWLTWESLIRVLGGKRLKYVRATEYFPFEVQVQYLVYHFFCFLFLK